MKRLFILLFLVLAFSFTFAGDATDTDDDTETDKPAGYAEVGGATESTSGSVNGTDVEVTAERNGFVELFIKNKTGRGTTNINLAIKVKGYSYSQVRIVSNKVATDTPDTESNFREVERGVANGVVELHQPDYTPDNPPTPLPNNGQLNIEFQIQVLEGDPGTWVNLPEGTTVTVNVYWTKGKYSDSRRAIIDSKAAKDDDEDADTKDMKENIDEETATDLDTEPKDIPVGDANNPTEQTTVTLPDIVFESIGYGYLNEGKVTITNPYALPFDFTGASIYLMPYRPFNVDWPENFKISNKDKRYLSLAEGGGVFQEPEIIANIKINEDNELEFVLNATDPSGVPWKATFLKPGAFLIRGLKMKIGGGLGNVPTWNTGDELFVGAKGDMIGGKVAEKLWHAATITAE